MNDRIAKTVVFVLLLLVMAFATPYSWASNDSENSLYPALKGVAQNHGIQVGVIDDNYNSQYFNSTIPYAFNSITPGNVMKFEKIHPCPPPRLITIGDPDFNQSVYDWVAQPGDSCTLNNPSAKEWKWLPMDQRMGWARDHGMQVHGHTLVDCKSCFDG